MAAALADPDRAELSPRVKATLTLLAKVTRDHQGLGPDDVAPVLAAGVAPAALVDALNVAFCFNVITRLADAFEFAIPSPDGFAAAARMLLARGYK